MAQGGPQSVVTRQRVSPGKLEVARQHRQEMTPAEAVLWRHLRGGRLLGLRFRRQQVVDGFIVDFYCHSARLVVEVDGPVHEGHTQYDAERDQVLAARALHVLRVTNDDVLSDCDAVLRRIHSACTAPSGSPLRCGEGDVHGGTVTGE